MGITPQQRADKSGKLEFKRYLKYSEHTVRGLKCEEKIFDGVILTHKQNELETSLKLLTDTCVELKVGDLIEWNCAKWLIWYKTISSYQPHDKFEIIKCNHEISWVDKDGAVHSSPCHIIGSQESKIKENFRTWNELITPQPNKFIEIIMPYQYIRKNTEIIVFDEAWRLVDYDKVSVPGVIYMSFTETKVNDLTDDLREQLANADKKQIWKINAPNELYLSVGDTLKIDYTISKDGLILTDNNISPEIMPGQGFIVNEFGEIIANEPCDTLVMVSYENALHTIQIHIGEAKPIGFISGDDYIRITQSAEYELVIPRLTGVLEFKSSNPKLAQVETNNNICKVITNKKNKLGTFTLSVEYDGVKYEKEIKIISLWQEV